MEPNDLKIKYLMDMPPAQHDVCWLQKSLQAAIELELPLPLRPIRLAEPRL